MYTVIQKKIRNFKNHFVDRKDKWEFEDLEDATDFYFCKVRYYCSDEYITNKKNTYLIIALYDTSKDEQISIFEMNY